MDPRITQQTRQTAAQQLTQWAAPKSLPPSQLEQMVNAILTGQNDAQILQAAGQPPVQESSASHRQPQPQPQTQQWQPFTNPFSSQMPFALFRMPPMPAMMNPTAPSFYPPPPTSVPNMFPNTGLQAAPAPSVHTTRTTFPGGETTQQSSSHAGQQGNTSFKYSSSSTSTNFKPGAQFPTMQPPGVPSLQYNATHQPNRLAHQPPPLYAPAPVQQPQPQPQIQQQQQQHHHQHQQAIPPPYFAPTQPQFSQPTQAPIYDDPNVFSPEPIYDSAAAIESPQNPRLAETFKRQLDEATYFSDVPGMPDLSVRRS